MSLDKLLQKFKKIKNAHIPLPNKAAQLKSIYQAAEQKEKCQLRERVFQCINSSKKSNELYGIFVGSALGFENAWSKAMVNLKNDSLSNYAASVNLAAISQLKEYFPEKSAEMLQKWIPRLPHQSLVSLSRINYSSALEQYALHQDKLEDPLDTLTLIFASRVDKIGYKNFLEEQSNYAKKYKIDEKIVNHIAKDALRKKLGIKY